MIDINNAIAFFTFPAGALGSVGVYTANETLLDTGTLTVTQTPEPSTLFSRVSWIRALQLPLQLLPIEQSVT